MEGLTTTFTFIANDPSRALILFFGAGVGRAPSFGFSTYQY